MLVARQSRFHGILGFGHFAPDAVFLFGCVEPFPLSLSKGSYNGLNLCF